MSVKRDLKTKLLTINMGPQHPATHGVLRLVLELDGETVVNCKPYVGYLHRGTEKLGENRTYPMALPLTDRLDYVSSMANNIGFCVAVERLLGIEVPERAKYIRTIMAELTRIANHIVWIATHALDIGAMTVFLYSMRDREWILELYEMACGARLTVTYPRIGGVRADVDQEFLDHCYKFTEEFPKRVEQYETLIDQNRIWLQRTKGIGVLTAEEAINLGLTGPTLRGSGVPYDVRKFAPYDAYDKVEFEVPVGKVGDVYDRYRCRMEEFRQSNSIIRQCLEKMPSGYVLAADAPGYDMAAGPRKKPAQPSAPKAEGAADTPQPPANQPAEQGPAFEEIYVATEVPKGELGFYFVSDGTGKPYRMRIRAPSFVHASALPKMCEGSLVADVIANIGTIDIVLGECDR
ncbi:MAG: NADH dehydrogenase (quinone) subunit D [Thermodesulfovibrionales bacterium]|nr:NADH dehydrogenase (quinone) subunit D [Thermodesulfovibrionales bacterium]